MWYEKKMPPLLKHIMAIMIRIFGSHICVHLYIITK